MAGIPMDQRDGWIWFDGELVPWKDAKVHVLTHGLHYASCVFEGERAYGGEIFKSREHTERLIQFGQDARLHHSLLASTRSRTAKRQVLEKNGLTDAYVRPVAWRGSETISVPARNNTVHLAIATWVWPSYFTMEERLKGIRLAVEQVEAPVAGDDPVHGQGRRPLHDLHALQARGDGRGLCRCADARLSRARRRGDRRQRVLHQGRRDPYADAGLLPQRHHPADAGRARQARTASRSSSGTSSRRSSATSTSASSPAPPRK